MEPNATSLVSKLAAVMAAVERVPKRGRNEFHRYDYATEADIVSVVRQELASRKVMLVPSVQNHERHDITTKKNERGDPLTVLHMTFTFYDGDSGESIVMPWLGVGQDGGDKGVYKAMTGGEKYFLMKTFLMPTGDDPENDSKDKKEKAKEEREAQQQAKLQQQFDESRRLAERGEVPPSKINKAQVAEIIKAATDARWTPVEFYKLMNRHGFTNEKHVTTDKIARILDALKNGTVVPFTPKVGEVAPDNALVV
jgi:hypothetical protein